MSKFLYPRSKYEHRRELRSKSLRSSLLRVLEVREDFFHFEGPRTAQRTKESARMKRVAHFIPASIAYRCSIPAHRPLIRGHSNRSNQIESSNVRLYRGKSSFDIRFSLLFPLHFSLRNTLLFENTRILDDPDGFLFFFFFFTVRQASFAASFKNFSRGVE